MEALLSITLFVFVAGVFVGGNLLLGHFVRPKVPNREKSMTYECGEEPFGPGWVQFDLRFYIVALVYLVFAVEVALFYPWAVAYGSAGREGIDGLSISSSSVSGSSVANSSVTNESIASAPLASSHGMNVGMLAPGASAKADAFAFQSIALLDMLIFFALLGVGFAYLWRFGYLDWVHGAARRGATHEG